MELAVPATTFRSRLSIGTESVPCSLRHNSKIARMGDWWFSSNSPEQRKARAQLGGLVASPTEPDDEDRQEIQAPPQRKTQPKIEAQKPEDERLIRPVDLEPNTWTRRARNPETMLSHAARNLARNLSQTRRLYGKVLSYTLFLLWLAMQEPEPLNLSS